MPKRNERRNFINDDLRVYDIKDSRPQLNYPEYNPAFPELPGVLLFIARCKSGKSLTVANMLNRDEMLAGVFEKIYIISPTIKIDRNAQLYEREEVEDLYELRDDVENVDEIITNIISHQEKFDIKDPDNLPPRVLVVFDDISGYLSANSVTANFFSRYRHWNCSIICSNQNIRTLPSVVRTNATAVFLASCSSTLEREKILAEWGEFYARHEPGFVMDTRSKRKTFQKMASMWDDAVKHKYNFLYLRLDAEPPRAFQFGADGMFEYDINTGEEDPDNLLTEEVETE